MMPDGCQALWTDYGIDGKDTDSDTDISIRILHGIHGLHEKSNGY